MKHFLLYSLEALPSWASTVKLLILKPILSMWLLRSLCDYYDLSVITTISLWLLWSLCDYYNLSVITMISLWLLLSVSDYYDLSVITTISLWWLRSLCDYYDLSLMATISLWLLRSLSDGYDLSVITTMSLWWLRSLSDGYDLSVIIHLQRQKKEIVLVMKFWQILVVSLHRRFYNKNKRLKMFVKTGQASDHFYADHRAKQARLFCEDDFWLYIIEAT